MKQTVIIGLILLICASAKAQEQYTVSPQRTWEHYPPEAQKRGFGLHQSQTAQMDGDGAPEVVLLFSAHNGHYPYFDLFKNYYVIIDHYTKEIKYTSDVVVSTEREIVLEDRNGDGRFELYRRYFKDGKFSTDKKGNNLSVTWVYDTIECKNTGTASTSANTATE
jgi:chitinase